MVFSEADDLEPVDRQASQEGKILPFPTRRAPDWLVGPADGLSAAADPDDQTTDEAPPGTLLQPVLGRPGLAVSPRASEPAASDESVADSSSVWTTLTVSVRVTNSTGCDDGGGEV